jgi:hypothetical protein
MNSSVPSAVERVQSASLPGSRTLRVAVLRLISFSSRRRRRSSAFSMAQVSSRPARSGSPDSQWSKWSRTSPSTQRAASGLASFSLVWPLNCGSAMNTESMAAAELSTSSAVIWPALRLPTSSP